MRKARVTGDEVEPLRKERREKERGKGKEKIGKGKTRKGKKWLENGEMCDGEKGK